MSRYSKKHYEDMALILAGYKYRPVESIVQDIVRMFANDNPNFDAARFLAACKAVN